MTAACPLLLRRQTDDSPGDFHQRIKLHRAPGIVPFYATGTRKDKNRVSMQHTQAH